METIRFINNLLVIVFSFCYAYQFIYLLVPFFKKRRLRDAAAVHNYAVLISARNEEAVIGQLIESIKRQDYPSDKIHVFVVADNCSDNTAGAARNAGAVVWERFDRNQVGKGYALDFLLGKIGASYPKEYFDGFFVFDADNLLDEHYITEMNKTFSEGYRIITSYRNSKNYGSNWISAGYSLWFIRNRSISTSPGCSLARAAPFRETGFLVSRDIIEKNDGWKFFLLTEDIEFSVHSVLEGERIAYCASAVLYDEQPVKFSQSWSQRLRWAKGFLQVFSKYGARLIKSIFSKKCFACFDMAMTIMPFILLTMISVFINLAAAGVGLYLDKDIDILIVSLWETVRNAYLILFALGVLTVITEWRNIHSTARKKILYLFTFPIFLLTYIPISSVALFKNVEWTPIQHSEVKTLAEVRGNGR
jgi:cellulose synthase/poly-beta-1,6-N-acetylglucosamine synthase-like glycosyltransferase